MKCLEQKMNETILFYSILQSMWIIWLLLSVLEMANDRPCTISKTETTQIGFYTSPLAEKAATATAKSVFLFRQEP